MSEVKGYTKRQRAWFMRVYGNQCCFHEKRNGIWLRCGQENNLELHHIYPRGWWSTNMKKDFEINGKDNGIMLCRKHHRIVHPDVTEALRNYHKGLGEVFGQMKKKRFDLCERGIPYWNTIYDLMFLRLNVRFVNAYIARYPNDVYPIRIDR